MGRAWPHLLDQAAQYALVLGQFLCQRSHLGKGVSLTHPL